MLLLLLAMLFVGWKQKFTNKFLQVIIFLTRCLITPMGKNKYIFRVNKERLRKFLQSRKWYIYPSFVDFCVEKLRAR